MGIHGAVYMNLSHILFFVRLPTECRNLQQTPRIALEDAIQTTQRAKAMFSQPNSTLIVDRIEIPGPLNWRRVSTIAKLSGKSDPDWLYSGSWMLT